MKDSYIRTGSFVLRTEKNPTLSKAVLEIKHHIFSKQLSHYILPILSRINEYTDAERVIQTERTNCNCFQFRCVILHHQPGWTAILDRLPVWFEIDTSNRYQDRGLPWKRRVATCKGCLANKTSCLSPYQGRQRSRAFENKILFDLPIWKSLKYPCAFTFPIYCSLTYDHGLFLEASVPNGTRLSQTEI